MAVTKESLLCDLYTDLKPVLEEEEVYLKIIRSSLRNGRETQHLQEQLEQRQRIRATVITQEAIVSCEESVYYDRGQAMSEAYNIRSYVYRMMILHSHYHHLINRAQEVGANSAQQDIDDHLSWLKSRLEEHNLKLALIFRMLYLANEYETYLEDFMGGVNPPPPVPLIAEGLFMPYVPSSRTESVREAMELDCNRAENTALRLLSDIREMKRVIHTFMFRIAHPNQDINCIDLPQE